MRFYVSPESISPDRNKIEIKDKAEIHHIRDVMRLKMGDVVNVFDGLGREFSCSMEEFKKSAVVMKIIKELPAKHATFPDITLYQAIPKKAKMDFIVEKAVELGVSRIVPIITERTIPDARDFTKKSERWRRISMASSKQCGRTRLAVISDAMVFKTALSDAKQNNAVIFASLAKGSKPLKEILKEAALKKAGVFIGPEGDFSPEEVSMAKEAGCSMCSLGGLILKSETAAIYILSCLSYEFQQ